MGCANFTEMARVEWVRKYIIGCTKPEDQEITYLQPKGETIDTPTTDTTCSGGDLVPPPTPWETAAAKDLEAFRECCKKKSRLCDDHHRLYVEYFNLGRCKCHEVKQKICITHQILFFELDKKTVAHRVAEPQRHSGRHARARQAREAKKAAQEKRHDRAKESMVKEKLWKQLFDAKRDTVKAREEWDEVRNKRSGWGMELDEANRRLSNHEENDISVS